MKCYFMCCNVKIRPCKLTHLRPGALYEWKNSMSPMEPSVRGGQKMGMLCLAAQYAMESVLLITSPNRCIICEHSLSNRSFLIPNTKSVHHLCTQLSKKW